MGLLARREHSRVELETKLRQREFSSSEIAETLELLIERDWQSDERYAAALLRSRVSKGHGPVRIANELKQKGVADELIAATLSEADVDWVEQCLATWQRKFNQLPQSYEEKAKQQRFLQYRGFNTEHMKAVFRR